VTFYSFDTDTPKSAPPPCWVCGAPDRRPVPLPNGAVALSCPECGLVHRWPLPSDEEVFRRLGRPGPVDAQEMERQRTSKETLRRWELRRVQELSPVGRLLDVGSGYGFFLDLARQEGWETEGVEISHPHWRYATEKFKLSVQNRPLTQTHFSPESFDVVTLWEVAELLADPWAVFNEVFRLLKPGGWIFLRSNNALFQLPALRIANHPLLRWLHLRPGLLHPFGLSPRPLSRALQDRGFVHVTHVPSPTTTGDPYRQGGWLGGLGVAAGKAAVRTAARTTFRLSGKIISSTFITRAQKPFPRPLVMHLITRLDPGGSAENVVLSTEKTAPDRCSALLISGKTGKTPGTAPRRVLSVPALRRSISPREDARAFLTLLRIFTAYRPALVHTHSSKAGFLGRWAARFAHVPRIVHTPHGHVFYGYFSAGKSRLYALLEKITAKITHRLVALTPTEKTEALRWGVGEDRQWRVVHSGVAWDKQYVEQKRLFREKMRQKLNVPQDALVVGFVGRLEPVKGARVLALAAEEWLRACLDRRFPSENLDAGPMPNPNLASLTRRACGTNLAQAEVRQPNLQAGNGLSEQALKTAGSAKAYFLLVGEGPERVFLDRIRARLPEPARLVLPGHQQEPMLYMAAMDIYVQPSLNEGMGKTLVLAQAMGLPVIASEVCGIPDVLRKNESGLLVPPGDPHALALAIEKLMGAPDLREKFARAGEKWVNDAVDGGPRFSVERMTNLLEKVYEELGLFDGSGGKP